MDAMPEMPSPTPIPVLTVCSLDPVLRDVTAAALLCDLPGAVALQHDLHADPAAGWALRRTIHDLDGVIEREFVHLDHPCLACALREDVLPTLRRLTAPDRTRRRPSAVVLALPVTAEALPVVRAVQSLGESAGAVAAAVLTTVDAATLEPDLFGDDLLAERGLELSADDRRAVGEVLAHQVEYADVLVTVDDDGPPPRAAALLAHLAPPATRVETLHALHPGALLDVRRPVVDDRGDLCRAAPVVTGHDAHGFWTVDLDTWRPLHPDRLHESIEALAWGPLRGRGRFWLPTRPDTLAAWDGAGWQLSIGAVGTWRAAPRRTRLVVTGSDHDADLVCEAFDRALLTDAELARGLDWWAGRKDGFGPWLGDDREAA